MRVLFFGFLIFAMWASIARYYYVCEIKGHCGEQKEIVDTNVRANTLSLKFGDETILEGYDEFSFKEGISKPTLNANNDLLLDSLASYLFDNEDKKLKIVGHFLEKEKDIKVGMFDNLGLARAAEIRQLLQDRGVEDGRISLSYQEEIGDVLKTPITFELLENENNELDDVQFTFTNMTFTESNFETNEDIFTPQESFLTYADSMATFFEFNPNKTLTITGHADKTGTEKHNADLGLRRAKSARQFLIDEKGIEVEIKVATMGENKPMATNKTKEGRAKNRRVNFLIE